MSDLANAFAYWSRQHKRATLRDVTPAEREAFQAGWAARSAIANRERNQVDMFGATAPAPAWKAPQVADAKLPETLDTSMEAAASLARGRMGEATRMLVYNAIATRPDTDKGLSNRLDIPENTVRPRRIELLEAGQIRAFGKANNPSGRQAVVWCVVHSTREPRG